MKPTIALALSIMTATLPLVASAQSPSSDANDLQLEIKRKRAIVLPKQTPEQVRSDADRAVDEYTGSRSPGALVDQTSPVRPSARPDLDPDVRGGIQTQRTRDALRNR